MICIGVRRPGSASANSWSPAAHPPTRAIVSLDPRLVGIGRETPEQLDGLGRVEPQIVEVDRRQPAVESCTIERQRRQSIGR